MQDHIGSLSKGSIDLAPSTIHGPSEASATATEASEATAESAGIASAEPASSWLSRAEIGEQVIASTTERRIASEAAEASSAECPVWVEDAGIGTDEVARYAATSRTANSKRIVVADDVP